MSAQVPMNMTITGCMLTFYRKTPTVVFWQWVNQSFNAVVNYSNRSGDAPITANCINIPLMRQRELQVGIPVTDEAGQRLGHSVTAAKQGIFQVVISRICMAIPAMAIPPVIMDTLEKKDFLKPGICHPAVLCPVSPEELHTSEQTGARTESPDPSANPRR
uniref:Sideroflexin-3 n=1 Tax=Rousettus aegyptiacus TaxID=9407 RepID=A0A7J8GFY2_ROUAE|nr:sideroflexin 3 [Rousettus aegyptiacus]